MADQNVELLVREGDVAQYHFVESPPPDPAALAADEVLVKVEKFGLTANNVTYAVIGRTFRYFEFFPATEPGHGKIPVWGMGRIEASKHANFPAGTRMYGYLPLGRYVTLRPTVMEPTGFAVDRGSLPAVYNRYWVTGRDPFHLPAQEDQMLVFRPLFFTSLLLDDYLAEHDYFGADTVLISSASAKTSYGLAYMLSRRRARGEDRRRYEIAGLTSPRNAPFVTGLGLYDEVVPYDGLAAIASDRRVIVVDIAGNPATLAAIDAHFGERRMATTLVGLSHWDRSPAGDPAALAAPPSPRTEFFFAPTWVEKRTADWGMAGLVERMSAGWRAFMEGVDGRCRIAHGAGKIAVSAAYGGMLKGEQRPDEGLVLSLWDDAFATRT